MEKVKVDHYQKVTDKTIALLEKGVAPWRIHWSKYGLARNYISNQVYTGINTILMNNTHHALPYFLTFDEAKDKGGSVIKGSKSHQVYTFKYVHRNEAGEVIDSEIAEQLKKDGKEVNTQRYIQYTNVFNVEDIANITFNYPEVGSDIEKKIQLCEAILKEMHDQPNIKNTTSGKLSYNPKEDFLIVSPSEQFKSPELFYAELFQKLIHWTGSSHRLNRDGITKYPKPNTKLHDLERLVGELGVNFLCGVTRIDRPAITEAAYFDNWLKVLKSDKYFIFKAASLAQSAADYILTGWCSKNEA